MSNFNIEIDLLKLKDAKVADVQGRSQTRRCICIPINNDFGTVTDSYLTRDPQSGEVQEVRKKGVTLKVVAYELKDPSKGQSHLLKPAVNKETYERLTEEDLRKMPWIGNVKPWESPDPSGSDW